MSRFYASFEDMLVLDERLIRVVENLSIGFLYVPNALPTENYMGLYSGPNKKNDGAVALTARRMIVAWKESDQCVRKLHIPTLNNFTERPLRSDKPNWPYQVIVMLPGGLVLIAQTLDTDKTRARQLSLLLNEAIVRLGVIGDDTGSMTAIASYEEEKERQRNRSDDDQNKKKDD